MPIRFRCAYCHQLMGIATRKAGQVVRCPKCSGEIIVPTPEDLARAAPADAATGNDINAAFENQDFDRMLEAAGPPIVQDHAPALMPTPIADTPPGLYITRLTLVLSLLGIGLLLALTFVLGFAVGKGGSPGGE